MNKLKSRKPKPAQLEVQWAEPESFALIVGQSIDGDRVAREIAERAADQQASTELQNQLL